MKHNPQFLLNNENQKLFFSFHDIEVFRVIFVRLVGAKEVFSLLPMEEVKEQRQERKNKFKYLK